MAVKKFLGKLDFNKIAVQNFVIQNSSTAPDSPVEGQMYIDTDDDLLYIYNGASWVACSSTDIAAAIHAATGKSALVDADEVGVVDTEASNVLKKFTIANLKAILKTYNDTLYTAKNASITGATKTKITYDAKGLVTAGDNATTADIADSSDKRYCTDAEKTVIGNTSGTNSGNETATSIGTIISGATAKATPVDADLFAIADTENSNVVKKFTIANLKTLLGAIYGKKYATTFGTAVDTSYTITHNLGTKDVIAQVRFVADDAFADSIIVAATTNTITIDVETAPGVDALRVTVIG